METASSTDSTSNAAPYPSFSSLRAAHAELLKLQRTDAYAPESLAGIDDFLRRGQVTGALLDDEHERLAAQSLLNYWSTLLDRAGTEQAVATLADFDPLLAPELDDNICPYRGLAAFGELDNAVFFGRQRIVDEWLGFLDKRNLLAVVGSSGSGKSSLVLGGLLPALRGGALPGSQRWAYYKPFVPGSDLLGSLARAVLPEGVPLPQVKDHVDRFRIDPDHLSNLVGASGDVSTMLVVDQFEEVFTLCDDGEKRLAFINNLLHLVAPAKPWPCRHTLVLTMRTDFEFQVALVPALHSLFEQSAVHVTALSAAELRDAIEKPADIVGLKFEEGIIDDLVKELLGEPAGLPLLQFSLLKLWELRERNRVSWAAYRRLGGARQALGVCADEFYSSLIPEERTTARRILLQMVRPGEGHETTSSRIRRQRLFDSGEASDRIERVLNRLLDAHLEDRHGRIAGFEAADTVPVRLRKTLQSKADGPLVRLTPGDSPGDDQVEIAHEALVRNWQKLADWVDEDRVILRHRIRFTAAAEQWRATGRDASLLLRGSALSEAQEFTGLSEVEAEFVNASRAAAEEIKREREEAERLEIAQAQELAHEKRGRVRAYGWLAVVSLALLVSVVLGISAFELNGRLQQAEASAKQSAYEANVEADSAKAAATQASIEGARADTAAAVAHSRELIAASLANLDIDPERSMLLAQLAGSISRSTDARDALQSAMHSSRIRRSLELHTDQVVGVAFGPDNTTLASASIDGTVQVADTVTGKQLQVLRGDGKPLWGLAFSRDGQMIAASGAGDTVQLWDVQSGKLRTFPGGPYGNVGVAFSPDGSLLASAGNDGTARVWDVATGSEIARLTEDSQPLLAVAFSPDGRRLAAGSDDRRALLWDLTDGSLIYTLSGHRFGVQSVAFSPDGTRIVTGSRDFNRKVVERHIRCVAVHARRAYK